MIIKQNVSILSNIIVIDEYKVVDRYRNFYSLTYSTIEEFQEPYVINITNHHNEYTYKIAEILDSIEIHHHKERLIGEIYNFVLGFLDFHSLETRVEAMNRYIDIFLGFNTNKKLELTLYQQVIEFTLLIIDKRFINIIRKISDLDREIIGLMIKYKVRTYRPLKEKELQINSLHFLMTSTSHIQNNLLAPVDSQSRYYKKFLKADENGDEVKKEKLKKLIIRNDKVLDEYKVFTQRLSTLFCTFESSDKQDNIKSVDFLQFLLDLVFTNGVNIKYHRVKLKVITTCKEEITKLNTILYENVLIASVYAIVENAVEAGATDIVINIKPNLELFNININITNNGAMILDRDREYIFFDHYSTNKQSGLGLPVAKRWLNEIASDVQLISTTEEKTVFNIELPLWSI